MQDTRATHGAMSSINVIMTSRPAVSLELTRTRFSPSQTPRSSSVCSGPTARVDHRIDTGAGDSARALLGDDQLPHIGVERSDRSLD